MKKRTKNIIYIVVGILLVPLATWSWNTSTEGLNASGLQGLAVLTMFIAYIIAIINTIYLIFKIKESRKEILFWIGLLINGTIAILPILFCILVMASGVRV